MKLVEKGLEATDGPDDRSMAKLSLAILAGYALGG
jgi:hypothetical protein